MTAHPDDRSAVWLEICHQVRDLGFDIGFDSGTDSIDRLTDAIITALTAVQAKRMPEHTAALIEAFRRVHAELLRDDGAEGAFTAYFRQGADLLEAQALRIADLTQFLADATRAIEYSPERMLRDERDLLKDRLDSLRQGIDAAIARAEESYADGYTAGQLDRTADRPLHIADAAPNTEAAGTARLHDRGVCRDHPLIAALKEPKP